MKSLSCFLEKKILFTEFVLDSTMSNAAGFQYFGGPYVTVLSSKTSQRYREWFQSWLKISWQGAKEPELAILKYEIIL